MFKKIFLMLIIATLFCIMIPAVAQARNIVGGAFDLSDASPGEIIIIESNSIVTLTGIAPVDVRVFCGTGVTLTLDNVTIETETSAYCPLFFQSCDNSELVLVGDSTLTGADNASALELDFVLGFIISGDGSLTATGGRFANGICDRAGGYGTMNGGTIYASGDVEGGMLDINYSLGVTNNANVFLEHSSGFTPITTTNSRIEYASVGEVPSEYRVPDTWSYPVCAYQKNGAPYFTADSINNSQHISIGDTPTRLSADDPNGKVNITSYSLTSGSLPDGITLNGDGSFSGIAESGDYTAHIEVRDADGLTDTTMLNITVTLAHEPADNSDVTTQKVKNPETGCFE